MIDNETNNHSYLPEVKKKAIICNFVELINKQKPVQYINLSRALSFERQKLMSRDILLKQK